MLSEDQIALPEQLPIPDGALALWVLYAHPLDQPDGYVLRAQFALPGGLIAISPIAWHADTPDKLRAIVPRELHCLPRQPDDDPAILETWI